MTPSAHFPGCQALKLLGIPSPQRNISFFIYFATAQGAPTLIIQWSTGQLFASAKEFILPPAFLSAGESSTTPRDGFMWEF